MAYQPEHTTVWTEIPVRDLDAAAAFYGRVTGLEMEPCSDPSPMVFFKAPNRGVAGHLYVGQPAEGGAGPTIHLAAEGTVRDMAARVTEAGGRVVSDPIKVPDGQFIYAMDLDGNSIGLFERT